MFAQRLMTETDMDGHLKNIPVLPPNCRLEIIFLGADNQTRLPVRNKRIRRPSTPFSMACGPN